MDEGIIEKEDDVSKISFIRLNRLLGDGDRGDDGEEEEEKYWWWDNDDEEEEDETNDNDRGDKYDDEDEKDDEKEDNKKYHHGNQGGRPPGNDDNHYDCESMLNYLDHLPPECQHLLGHDDSRPGGGGPPTSTTNPPPSTYPGNGGNGDTAVSNQEDILIRMTFRVGLRTRLRPRQVFRLRAAVANAVSRILHRKSPFHVPRPIWNDAILDYLLLFKRDDDDGDWSPTRNSNNPSRPQDKAESDKDSNDGWRHHDDKFEPPMDPTLMDPTSIDPTSFSNEMPPDNDDDGSQMKARGRLQKKGNLWLHHYNTDLFEEVTQNATTQRWYYPLEVQYFVFWDILRHLVKDPQVLSNITRICWHIGNETLANGEMKQAIMGEIENNTVFDAIDSIFFGDKDSEDWASLDDDLMDLDGQGDGVQVIIPDQSDLSDTTLPTYPTRLSSSSTYWGRQEYFGLYLMIFTLVVASVMRYGSARYEGADGETQLSPNKDEKHSLTKEGVDEFLKVGWNYQEQNTGNGSSQLYLHVYDKSSIGYSPDNSMLIGGNEQTAMNTSKQPKAKISPSQTASTEQETNSTVHRDESLTNGSERNKTSSSCRGSSQSFKTEKKEPRK